MQPIAETAARQHRGIAGGGGGALGATYLFATVLWRWGTSRPLHLGGGLELSGGLIFFGGCAPGTPPLGDGVVLVEASMP